VADDIRETWDEIARHWDDWGPPLRPSPEDLATARRALMRWHAEARPTREPVQIFLCGVTPEIATMAWPFRTELTGMDHVEAMVRIVWPGDVPGVRHAVVGDWLHPGLPAGSQDVVIGDGGFGFFDPPTQRALARSMQTLLRPGGLFLYRHWAGIEDREPLDRVVRDARSGSIGNFHVFKWRVAMALQPDSRAGVRLHDIWQACTDARLDTARLPQPGWSARATGTIRFYRDRDARLYFPTLDEFREMLSGDFERIEVEFGTYELAERCPVLIARRRP
jgi:SAM-dependent methyltransferase